MVENNEIFEKLRKYCQEEDYPKENFRLFLLPLRPNRELSKESAAAFFNEITSDCPPEPISLKIVDDNKNGYPVITAFLSEGKWQVTYNFEEKK